MGTMVLDIIFASILIVFSISNFIFNRKQVSKQIFSRFKLTPTIRNLQSFNNQSTCQTSQNGECIYFRQRIKILLWKAALNETNCYQTKVNRVTSRAQWECLIWMHQHWANCKEIYVVFILVTANIRKNKRKQIIAHIFIAHIFIAHIFIAQVLVT